MGSGSGYLRQRRGELEHHAYFGERPSAYLTYSHIRLRADHRTGIAEVTASTVAEGTGMSLKVIRADLRWLCEADEVTGRPPYLALLERGNQHRPGRYEVLKYPVADVYQSNSALSPQGQSTDPCPTPTGVEHIGCSIPTGVEHIGCSIPMGTEHDTQLPKTQGVTTPNKKEEEEGLNNPTARARARDNAGAGFFDLPVALILSEHRHTKPFAAALGMVILKHARFNVFLGKFLREKVIPDFTTRRRKEGATPEDFIRYARKRMSRLIESEAERNLVSDEHGLIRPGTKRFVEYVDRNVTEPWKRVLDNLSR